MSRIYGRSNGVKRNDPNKNARHTKAKDVLYNLSYDVIQTEISKEELRKIVFENYSNFIKYAKSKFPNIEYQGLSHDELVNEAIINIFDVKRTFINEDDIINFIQTSIKTVGYNEKESLKDIHFYTKNNDDKEYSNIDKVAFIDTPSDEFIKIYEMFEICRFGENKKDRICNRCTAKRFFNLKDGRIKCSSCGYKMSITAKTYISEMKLSYVKLYKLVITLCEDPLISSVRLAKKVKITQKTAYFKKIIIESAIQTIQSYVVEDVLKKILTNTEYDEIPIVRIETGQKKYSKEDIINIRRLRNERIFSAKKIGEMYDTDQSTIIKIAKGKMYASY